MTYQEAVKFLYDSTPMFQQIGAAAYKPGLDTTYRLDKAFGHPHRNFKSIHIGGTNGKGSTAHTIASILREQGYKVGLYTSPHLIDFRERIRVNGEMIPEEEVVSFIERFIKMDYPEPLSFFELTTMLAFDYFSRSGVDYAVIEVGLGGRLDCTNIITPILSVITNISKDHVAQLGDSLTKIASEKAGIMKKGVPCVIGEAEGEVRDVFIRHASEVQTPLVFAVEQITEPAAADSGCIVYPETVFGKIESPLTGDCQPKNTATIISAIMQLREKGVEISDETVRKGFMNVCKTTGLMGRWMVIGKSPLTVCDTGHNIGGWKYLAKRLAEYSDPTIVIGFVNDKDISSILEILPDNAKYIFTSPSIPRALPAEKLSEEALSHGLKGETSPTVAEAYRKALAVTGKNSIVFIGGSTFVVADLLSFLSR